MSRPSSRGVALGLALFALFGTSARSFDAALFGSILGVGLDDVVAIFVVSILAAVLIFLRRRALLFTTFDPDFARMLHLAAGIGAVCGFVGMNLSYHLDVPSGPTIVLVAATLFAAVFVITGATGRRRAATIAAPGPAAPPAPLAARVD